MLDDSMFFFLFPMVDVFLQPLQNRFLRLTETPYILNSVEGSGSSVRRWYLGPEVSSSP